MKIPVRYNHVGYAPDSAKIIFVNPKELEPVCGNVEDYFFRVVRQVENSCQMAVTICPIVYASTPI